MSQDAKSAAGVSSPTEPRGFPDATIVEISRDNAAHALDEMGVWLCVHPDRGALPNSSLLDRCTYGEAVKRTGPRGEAWPPWPCQTCASRVAAEAL